MRNRIDTAISGRQCQDTGLIITLVLIIIGLKTNNQVFYISALCSSIINLLVPTALRPLAFLWFGLSKILGIISSRIVLTLIFFFVVTPVALIRRWSGKDSLNLRKFKKNGGSVFIERYHKYDNTDMIHLY